MKDTVAVACPAEGDAVWGSRWSPGVVGWLAVPGDAGWLPWRDALARCRPHAHLHTPAGTLTPMYPSVVHPWVAPRTLSPPEKSLMEALPVTLPSPAPSKAAIRQAPPKKPSTERHHFPHKRDVFVQRGSTSRAHTDFPLLSAFLVWRRFMTSHMNFPEAPFIRTLSTSKFTHPCANPPCGEAVCHHLTLAGVPPCRPPASSPARATP